MERLQLAEVAARAGVDTAEVERLVDLAILTLGADGRFSSGDVRRVTLVRSFVQAGIPLEGLGAAIRDGKVSLGFLDAPAFDRFSVHGDATFAQQAERTGVPLELLTFIREAAGSNTPGPDDRVRAEELPYVEIVDVAFRAGFRPSTIRQLLRVHGDSMRRIAETESAVWLAEVITPAMAAGQRVDEILGSAFGDRVSLLMERAIMGMYHLQQMRAWSVDIIDSIERQLAAAGVHSRLEHPPAMCFLDITGYTRLTAEQGDVAAAALAEQVGHVVHRTSIRHGGRPVKWLGDGVMFHFPDPGRGVDAALEMIESLADAGLPPAHVGLHAGPVIFQEGDYYGQTVNLASRIADHAAPGEVLVSQAVIEASAGAALTFDDIGPVELKGVAGPLRLYRATRTGGRD